MIERSEMSRASRNPALDVKHAESWAPAFAGVTCLENLSMPGLEPGIQTRRDHWMAGSGPAMENEKALRVLPQHRHSGRAP